MSNFDAPADLRSTFVVVNRELQADTIAVADTIWSDLDRKFGDFTPGEGTENRETPGEI